MTKKTATLIGHFESVCNAVRKMLFGKCDLIYNTCCRRRRPRDGRKEAGSYDRYEPQLAQSRDLGMRKAPSLRISQVSRCDVCSQSHQRQLVDGFRSFLQDEVVLRPESHQRQLVDSSDPFYRPMLCAGQNPTNGSWWIVQIGVNPKNETRS